MDVALLCVCVCGGGGGLIVWDGVRLAIKDKFSDLSL